MGETKADVVFPAILQIDKNLVFRKKDPMILGCDVIAGQLRIGTPICVPEAGNVEIGRVSGIEKDKKPYPKARRGDRVCVKIEQNTSQQQITIESIDTLKTNFRDEMTTEDWEVVKGMKTVFN